MATKTEYSGIISGPQTEVVDPIRASVEKDLTDLQFREPVIDSYDPAIYNRRAGEDPHQSYSRIRDYEDDVLAKEQRIDQQWLGVTEAMRRSILSSQSARRAAAEFSSQPLSETLPLQAIMQFTREGSRPARLARLSAKTLRPLLEIEPIPDNLLNPDIQYSPRLQSRDDVIDSLITTRTVYPEGYSRELETARQSVTEYPGITRDERRLVARRYRYARDVKLLGLMAELVDQPLTDANEHDGLVTHELKSGTKLVMTVEAFAADPNLLDPSKWERRQQLKDRVYRVKVENKTYLMKERKTARHTDVKKNGHVDGLTSEQEFETARQFARKGVIQDGDISLHWENPLGYVEFPDGYQFCLFEIERGLETSDSLSSEYRFRPLIEKAEDAYQQEFESVKKEAKEIYSQRKDLMPFEQPAPIPRRRLPFIPRRRKSAASVQPEVEADELKFDEFVTLKAHYLHRKAQRLLNDTMWAAGYTNNDQDGFAFRYLGGSRPTLEIVGFDFEYYRLDQHEADRLRRLYASRTNSGYASRDAAYNIHGVRDIARAASYAMLRQQGYAMPSQPNDITDEVWG